MIPSNLGTLGVAQRLVGLAAVRSMIEEALQAAVVEALSAGESPTTVANWLGVSRSTLYRRYPVTALAGAEAS